MNCPYCGKVFHGRIMTASCDQCGGKHSACDGCKQAPFAVRGMLPNVTLHVKKCPPPILPKGKP